MPKLYRHLTSVLLSAIAGSATVAETAQYAPATGQISVERTETGYSIAASVTGQTEVAVTTELSIQKSDSSGQMSTRQGSEVFLAPGQTETLAHNTVSLDEDGRIEAVLILSQNGIAFDRIEKTVLAGRTDQ